MDVSGRAETERGKFKLDPVMAGGQGQGGRRAGEVNGFRHGDNAAIGAEDLVIHHDLFQQHGGRLQGFAQVAEVDDDEGGAGGKPEPVIMTAQHIGRYAEVGLQTGQGVAFAILDRKDPSGAAIGDVIQFLLPHLEEAAIRAEPEPAVVVRNNFGQVAVIQTLRGGEAGEVSVFEPAETPTRVADPEAAIGGGGEAADGGVQVGETGGFIGEAAVMNPE